MRNYLETQRNQLCDTSDYLQMVMQHNEQFDSSACKSVQTEASPALFIHTDMLFVHASWVISAASMLRVLTV